MRNVSISVVLLVALAAGCSSPGSGSSGVPPTTDGASDDSTSDSASGDATDSGTDAPDAVADAADPGSDPDPGADPDSDGGDPDAVPDTEPDVGPDVSDAKPDVVPDADAQPDTPTIPANCTTTPTDESKLCIEHATAAAGSEVDIPIYVLGKVGCSMVDQSFGEIPYAAEHFTLTSPYAQCFIRDARDTPDDHIYWHAFTASAVGPSCPDGLPVGLLDIVTFHIDPATPPGDYLFEWRNPAVSAMTPGCEGASGIDGVVTVTPCPAPCPVCPDDADCSAQQCGLDPICATSCGECYWPFECTEDNQCEADCPAQKDCWSLECGPDPICGLSCGTCTGGDVCQDGMCVMAPPDCPAAQDCSGIECGVDPVCLMPCGTCPAETPACIDGVCTVDDGPVWPMGSHDRRRSGLSPYVGSQTDTMELVATIGDSTASSTLVVGADGTFYVGDWGGVLHAIAPDGGISWTYDLGGNYIKLAIGADGTIYAAAANQQLTAISSAGAFVWSVPIGYGAIEPIIGADGTIYQVADDTVYAVEPDGDVAWTFASGGFVWEPAIAASHDMIYVALGDTLHALSTAGVEQWTWSTAGYDDIYFVAYSGAPGIVYVAYKDWVEGKLLAGFNAAGAAPLWEMKIDDSDGTSPTFPTVGPHGNLYIFSPYGIYGVFAVTPMGQKRWVLKAWNWYEYGAIGADGTLYFVSFDDVFAATLAGEHLWTKPTDISSVTITTAPVVAKDGRTYFFVYDELYRLGP